MNWILHWKNDTKGKCFMGAFFRKIYNSLNRNEILIAQTFPLPFINLKASDPNAINSALVYVADQCVERQEKYGFVTLDMQLYIVVKKILATTNNALLKEKIFLRPGGLHIAMNFQGAIGHIMEGSGLEELLQTVYGGPSVKHIMSGHKYSSCIRAYAMVRLAVELLALQDYSFEINTLLDHLDQDPTEIPGNTVLQEIRKLMEDKLTDLASHPTAMLWYQFVRHVRLLNTFTVAERLGDYDLYLFSLSKMIPVFFAAGHYNYAKFISSYVADLVEIESKMSAAEFDDFKQKLLTIRRTDNFYSGTSPDMVIEQDLMRNLKVKGGLIGRGYSEPVVLKWIKSFPHCTRIILALEKFSQTSTFRSEQHREEGLIRMKKDESDFKLIYNWFQNHNPFNKDASFIISLASGEKFSPLEVNYHKADEIGETLRFKYIGQDILSMKSKKSEQVKNFRTKISTQKEAGKSVLISPQKIASRLILFAGDEEKLIDIFSYELSSVPLSIFKENGTMRSGTKNTLFNEIGKYYKAKVCEISKVADQMFIIDGEYLFHKIKWTPDSAFKDLANLYVHFVTSKFSNCTIVFESIDENNLIFKQHVVTKEVDCDLNATVKITQLEFFKSATNRFKFTELLIKSFTAVGVRCSKAHNIL